MKGRKSELVDIPNSLFFNSILARAGNVLLLHIKIHEYFYLQFLDV